MSENDGKVKLDGLNVLYVYLWPKSIQEENGIAQLYTTNRAK